MDIDSVVRDFLEWILIGLVLAVVGQHLYYAHVVDQWKRLYQSEKSVSDELGERLRTKCNTCQTDTRRDRGGTL